MYETTKATTKNFQGVDAMRFYTHIAGSILFFMIYCFFMDIANPFMGLFFAAWISVFPDLIDKLTGKHRGWGHSIFWILPLFLVALYQPLVGAALIIGFLSHLFLDIFTVYGCPLLYPVMENSFVCLNKNRRIKTGSNQDKSALVFILLLTIPLLLFHTPLATILDLDETLTVSYAVDNKTDNNRMTVKNNINLNLQVSNSEERNITVEKVNDTVTTIMVTRVNRKS